MGGWEKGGRETGERGRGEKGEGEGRQKGRWGERRRGGEKGREKEEKGREKGDKRGERKDEGRRKGGGRREKGGGGCKGERDPPLYSALCYDAWLMMSLTLIILNSGSGSSLFANVPLMRCLKHSLVEKGRVDRPLRKCFHVDLVISVKQII